MRDCWPRAVNKDNLVSASQIAKVPVPPGWWATSGGAGNIGSNGPTDIRRSVHQNPPTSSRDFAQPGACIFGEGSNALAASIGRPCTALLVHTVYGAELVCLLTQYQEEWEYKIEGKGMGRKKGGCFRWCFPVHDSYNRSIYYLLSIRPGYQKGKFNPAIPLRNWEKLNKPSYLLWSYCWILL